MKIILKIAAIVVVLLVVSCNNKIVEKPSQLLLQGSTTPLTRYSGSGGFEEGDAVGVYVVKNGANEGDILLNGGNYTDNKKFINKYESSLGLVLKPEFGEEVYWTDAHIFDIYSYSPYINSVSSVNSIPFSISSAQSVAIGYFESDFLWAKVPKITPKASPIQVDYKHLLSEINVYIYPGEGYSANDLKDILTGVTLKDVVTDAKIDLSSGVVTAGVQQGAVTTYRKTLNDIVFSAIIIPQSITNAKHFIDIKVGDKSYPVSFDMVAVSGKSYKVKITVDKGFNNSEVTLNGVTSWDFVDGPSQTVPIINPIHKNIKNYCVVNFENSNYSDICLDGATIGSFVCESGKGNDYYDYAHNPDKRANITDNMYMEVRFKNLTSSNSNKYNVYVYVDWNNDGDFPDQNEHIGFKEVVPGVINTVQKLNYSISIPSGAISPTTMRIMCVHTAIEQTYTGCGTASGTTYDVPIYF